ncbi:coronin-2B [Callorhinchus milii]|uniref:Coronin n=1 Tax=Callorhinchus milii TaxID=7868 RepID=A0A4W3IXG3_CALMI|nr:coronin-2B [Callorhinchus milii]XP_007904782.1 coronin-2B [Callorhinchus milii]XP_007904784.1 coronin-2B [Callorhinchus milii]XP_007904785.1 coronin-2B [Callorhinchus milii]|eukprot:gi/632976416/ref/XP_007904781.1/ PREDICTED: coronin-2B-like [Callorhinchus milii]
MSWRPQYRSSKFRHVYGKPASKENCYDGISITKSVHDNLFCAVNPRFIAVVTECAGGGAFFVIPIGLTGKLDPLYPKVCGHRGNVLDVKWNPFDDWIVASCSEDCTIKLWEIPKCGIIKNIVNSKLELQGHSRRVGLIEWHPTAKDILFSAGYDYRVMIWKLNWEESVITNPVKIMDFHRDVIISISFNTDGSRFATSCKDRKLRIVDAHSGVVLQESSCKSHKVNKVLFLGNLKMLLTVGSSRWNNRQIAFWDEEDLSVPLLEEDLDGSSGVLFPFYDPDTHMLYLAGKGDGNIRYYELSSEKPYHNYLMDFRSSLPQKGMAVMPKRGLDVSACEVFRFYKLVTIKSLIEPVSMIVPRRSDSYQDDIYPMTSGAEPALTAQEWLNGINRGPILISLKPGCNIMHLSSLKAGYNTMTQYDQKEHQDKNYGTLQGFLENKEQKDNLVQVHDPRKNLISNGFDLSACPAPKTENELLQMFYRQQEEIRKLREILGQKEVRIKQLELEIKNVRNSPIGY